MKYIVIVLLATVLLWAVVNALRRARKGSACCGEREAVVKRRGAADRRAANYPYAVELEIGGMTCENCARRVENALNALDGVYARADIATHRARVRLKAFPDEAALRRAVASVGYAVLGVTSK